MQDKQPNTGTTIKLEHDNDLDCWHHRLDLNSNRLLLQNSDDPLISHGAANDVHDEDHPFKTLLASKTQEQQQRHKLQHHQHHYHQHHQQHLHAPTHSQQQQQHNVAGACSSLTKQQLKANLLMGARKVTKSQAQMQLQTPSEVKATQIQTTKPRQSKKRQTAAGALKLRFHHQALPAEYAAHFEATQGNRPNGRPATLSTATGPPPPPPPANPAHENVRSWLRKIAEIQRTAERQQQQQKEQQQQQQQRQQPQQQQQQQQQHSISSKVEVSSTTRTKDIATPIKRSTVKYTDLPYMGEITLDNYKPRRGRKPKKADICHLIYKNYGTIVPNSPPVRHVAMSGEQTIAAAAAASAVTTVHLPVEVVEEGDEEPLNLCLRDQSNDRYSISSTDSSSDRQQATITPVTTDTPTPTTTTDCRSSCTTPLSQLTTSTNAKPLANQVEVEQQQQQQQPSKLLLQPAVGLYYQQLMENCNLAAIETIEKDNQLALKIPIPNGFFAKEPNNNHHRDSSPLMLRKRKRSAIFIPPMPAEPSASPSTEVSICKFKFTGGAKPSLQEKKMLSVDAEGNYRYYNGTGDKTLRGYEFISREQQQQQQQQQQQPHQLPSSMSSSGGSDKIYIDIPPPSTDLSLELLHIPPESPTSSLLLPTVVVAPPQSSPLSAYSTASQGSITQPQQQQQQQPPPNNEPKRRSSRRSKQREKLEKTFKEKGFLIQTQQLQSAEGATYCKFRQLKKFTRYLFRNWKDHIPDSDLAKHHHHPHPTSHNGPNVRHDEDDEDVDPAAAAAAAAVASGGVVLENLLGGPLETST